MTDGGQADVQPDSVKALPLAEFDPRGCRGTNGAPVDYCVHPAPERMHDSMFDQLIMTTGKVKDRIAGLILDIEALKVIEGCRVELKFAAIGATAILGFIEVHERKAAAEIEATH